MSRRVVVLLLLALLFAASHPAFAQRRPHTPSNPPSHPPAPVDGARILAFLNRTIAWDERLDAQAQWADQPTDVLYVNDNRQLGRQIVVLSFDAAKAQVQLLASTAPVAQAPAPGMDDARRNDSQRMQRLTQRATTAADLLRREHTRLDALQQQLASATPDDRARLEAAVAEAQSRVAIAQARNDAVSGIVGFMNDAAGGAAGADINSQISALEQAVSASATAHQAPLQQDARKAQPSSVVGLISDLIALNQKASALQGAARDADFLQRDARDLTAPLTNLLSQTRQRADLLMNAPDTADPAELLRRKSALDALTARFRQLSAALLPLTKRRILLNAYKANLGRWRASVDEQHRGELRRLTFRAVALGIMLLLVFTLAVVWRRMTFRYVQDVKRRHHVLLVRRIVLLLLVAAILAATFASDFSSLTTFVGLLTAGIAIALQDVILSMAGYFVIIGKYGIRPGDRVRIASVNGDVLDVGLVWIYLIELETRGSDQLPTGRIVEFPNSVVFDHSAGIFKQLPGTRFLWHEVARVVAGESDFATTQARMLAAVESVFEEYRDAIDRQHREMERLLNTKTPPPRPHSRLRVAPAGVEIRVRYPVEIANAGTIDDRIAAAVMTVTQLPAA
ncbi:MAG: mechanosensitive ion channel [Acidobacteria bacterium]|nr:mechanosensitive ion channel [Acidobacteriota bacterium]MBV9477915.1 mechanosensitive ion channel [Acidobacteriota bacterium]